MAMEKRYLFVCGCPRSGTTALWRLLTDHPKIVLGVERYVWFSFKDGKLNPSLFARDRFFDLQNGDTFYKNLSDFNQYYQKASERFEYAEWVGDKAPQMYKQYETIEKNFARAHIIFIVRNIIDVAASYQKRAQDPNDQTWDAKRDYRLAVEDWRDSLKRTLAFCRNENRQTKVTILSYEDLFLTSANIAPIFASLDLEVDENASAGYRALTSRSRELNVQRGDGLNSEQRYYISTNAPFGLYRAVLEARLNIAQQE